MFINHDTITHHPINSISFTVHAGDLMLIEEGAYFPSLSFGFFWFFFGGGDQQNNLVFCLCDFIVIFSLSLRDAVCQCECMSGC